MLKGICNVCEKETNFVYLYPLRKDERYKIYKCNNCNFEFLYPIPEISEISNIYNDSNYPAHYLSKGSEKAKKKNFKNILNIAKRFLISNEVNFLDIGAGLGYAMEVAQELGWRSYGIEISKNAYTFLEKKFDKDKIFNCDFLDFKTDIKFDVITMFDFLEHTVDFQKAIMKTFDILNNNGLIIITTPNTNSLSRKILKKFWFQYKLEHLSYLNRNNIRQAICKYFNIVVNKRPIKFISLNYLLNYINYFYINLKIIHFLYDITIPLPISGEMLIIAKKVI